MQIYNNTDLGKYTTIKMGGTAKCLFFPESPEDLSNIFKKNKVDFIIGGGSNLLISNREFNNVVNLKRLNLRLERISDGLFTVGASIPLVKLIAFVNNNGYGGIENLCTVPGLTGGAVAMNAGTSINEGNFIGNYVKCIRCFDTTAQEMITFNKDECQFSFRSSLFKNNNRYIIYEVEFEFPEQEIAVSKRKCQEKKDYLKKVQDVSAPNFGSVFSCFDGRIMNIIKKMQLGKHNGVHFSNKTINWILNSGSINSNEAIRLIKFVRIIHRLFGRECKTEVVIIE